HKTADAHAQGVERKDCSIAARTEPKFLLEDKRRCCDVEKHRREGEGHRGKKSPKARAFKNRGEVRKHARQKSLSCGTFAARALASSFGHDLYVPEHTDC